MYLCAQTNLQFATTYLYTCTSIAQHAGCSLALMFTANIIHSLHMNNIAGPFLKKTGCSQRLHT